MARPFNGKVDHADAGTSSSTNHRCNNNKHIMQHGFSCLDFAHSYPTTEPQGNVAEFDKKNMGAAMFTLCQTMMSPTTGSKNLTSFIHGFHLTTVL